MAPSAPACSRSGNSRTTRHRTPPDHPAVGNQAEQKRQPSKTVWSLAGDHRNSAVQISHGSSRNSPEWLCWIRHKVEFAPCHLCYETAPKTPHKLKSLHQHLLVQNTEIPKPFSGWHRTRLGDCSWLAMKKSEKKVQVWPVWIDIVIFICQLTNQILFQISW